MKEIKYLLDENVDPSLRRAVHQHWSEIVIWIIGDPGAPKHGTSDPDILIWCEANNFSLVTNNRASMAIHLQNHLSKGRKVPGIFILNPDMTMGEVVQELALICGASESQEYYNMLNFLPIGS